MDYSLIIFIVVAVGGIFLFWKITKTSSNLLAGTMPKKDDSEELIDGGSTDNAADRFSATVARLEIERKFYYDKTKGLFKRAFLRTLIILFLLFYALANFTGEQKEFNIEDIIGPLMMAAILSLIGAGIYSLIKKGSKAEEFSRKLKQGLVAEIVKATNPDLTFYEEGIDMESFDKANLFPDGHGTYLDSEDKIEGVIDGCKVIISECVKKGYDSVRGQEAELKIGGVTIGQSGLRDSKRHVKRELKKYFRGLFLQMELKDIYINAPIRVLPISKINHEIKFGISISGQIGYVKENLEESKFNGLPGLAEKPYEIFCTSTAKANQIINDKFIKILDFVYGKYAKKGESNNEDSLLGGALSANRGVYFSMRENMIYMAIAWNKDMFETDTFIKKNLEESGIAQEIYNDLQFINQVIKEVSQFNKVAT